jgi:hypothetical protein
LLLANPLSRQTPPRQRQILLTKQRQTAFSCAKIEYGTSL